MEAAAGVRDELHQHTAPARGGTSRSTRRWSRLAPWRRPSTTGRTPARREYWAVRKGVSVMDVGTLGKFLVAGPDATAFLERLYPCRVSDLEPGRFRYAVLLGEHGFVVDDGIVCALGDGRWYVTFTSSGAAAMEATLKDWAETFGHEVHIVDLTAASGAINVAGPQARELLQRLSPDALDNEAFPYLRRELTVAGVPCSAIRLGFVGELSYELHHASDRSGELWDALLEAGRDLGIRPHGLDALRLLRLEKGHIIIGQDTDFDATPAKLNMSWAVRDDKPWFVGKRGLERAAAHEAHGARGSSVFRGGASRGRPAARRGAPRGPAHVFGLVPGPGMWRRARLGRARERVVPERARERRRAGDRRRARVLRPRGRAPPCLSSRPSRERSSAALPARPRWTPSRRGRSWPCASRRPSSCWSPAGNRCPSSRAPEQARSRGGWQSI